MSVDAAKDVLGHREKEKGFLQAGKCRQSRTGQVSLARLACVSLSDMFKPSSLIFNPHTYFSLCSDQSAMKNVFDFLQDYVPQVGIFPNLIHMHHDIHTCIILCILKRYNMLQPSVPTSTGNVRTVTIDACNFYRSDFLGHLLNTDMEYTLYMSGKSLSKSGRVA